VLSAAQSQRKRRVRQSGTTIAEVLTMAAVAGVLLSAGAPSMQSLAVRNRVQESTHLFVTTLTAARNAAVERGAQVVIARAPDASWRDGWTVFVDDDRDGAPGSGEEILRQVAALPIEVVAVSDAKFAEHITFDASGRLLTAGGGAILLCHPAHGASRAVDRLIVVNASGRTRIESEFERPDLYGLCTSS